MPLISLRFFALALTAILCSALVPGRARAIIFFFLNLIFVYSYLTPAGMASTIAFCGAGYVFIRLALAGKRWALPLGLFVLVVAFVYMRNYAFLGVILPKWILTNLLATVGLSFLLFKILHVLIDANAGVIAECDALMYANYCINFTTFLIGPLQRFESFTAQWTGAENSRPLDFSGNMTAVNRILRGLVKKFVLAEMLSPYIASAPNLDYHSIGLSSILLKAWTFYAYLYCDFSGYCDIVIGIGTLLGVRPPENFNLPFFSRNVAEFWLRMHKSLTEWLTSYVFNPLFAEGLRMWRSAALPAMLIAIMITMIVSGLWHGTTTAFLIFGILHGFYLVVYRLYERGLRSLVPAKQRISLTKNPAVSAAAIFITFNACALAYLCFILSGRQLGQVVSNLIHRI